MTQTDSSVAPTLLSTGIGTSGTSKVARRPLDLVFLCCAVFNRMTTVTRVEPSAYGSNELGGSSRLSKWKCLIRFGVEDSGQFARRMLELAGW